MTASYQFFRSPKSRLKEGTEETYYPRIVGSKAISTDKMCEKIAMMSNASAGTASGVLTDLKKLIIQEIMDGNRVVWEGLGSFYVTLSSDPVRDPDKVRAESIRISKIVFKPDKNLKRKLGRIKLERAGNYRKETQLTPEVRQERILRYVKKHHTIQTNICMGLNGTSRYTSQLDLKALVKEKKLILRGGNRNTHYTLPPND